MTSPARPIRVVLMLNAHERATLRKIVAAGGHKNKQEAMRYLIRSNDPDATYTPSRTVDAATTKIVEEAP
jgi:hypothetical protein